MIGHLRTLLTALTQDVNQPLSALPLVTDAEQHQLTTLWNEQKQAPQPVTESCVHELFATQATKQPDAVAVVFQDEQWTYRELNERANQLAHRLQKAGVGQRRWLACSSSVRWRWSLVCWRFSKQAAPMYRLIRYTQQIGMTTILETAEPRMIVTQTHLLSLLPETTETSTEIVCVDEEQLLLEPVTNP